MYTFVDISNCPLSQKQIVSYINLMSGLTVNLKIDYYYY
jgi:hypothetical protein